MQYKINGQVDPIQLADLRQSVGWNRMERESGSSRLKNYLQICCYDDTKLIGFVSAVSNGVTDAYIQDLMVNPEYQNRGIGTALMNQAIGYIKKDGIYMISVVYGEENLKTFYEKFGFYTMLCGQMETDSVYRK